MMYEVLVRLHVDAKRGLCWMMYRALDLRVGVERSRPSLSGILPWDVRGVNPVPDPRYGDVGAGRLNPLYVYLCGAVFGSREGAGTRDIGCFCLPLFHMDQMDGGGLALALTV